MKTSPPVKLRASHRNQGTQDRDPFRASCEAAGVTLAPMDMMIAAHAKAVDAILVTRDRAFLHLPDGLMLEDWTVDGQP